MWSLADKVSSFKNIFAWRIGRWPAECMNSSQTQRFFCSRSGCGSSTLPVDCDLCGRKIFFTNSKTLVSVATDRDARVTFDLLQCQEPEKMKRNAKKNEKHEKIKKTTTKKIKKKFWKKKKYMKKAKKNKWKKQNLKNNKKWTLKVALRFSGVLLE